MTNTAAEQHVVYKQFREDTCKFSSVAENQKVKHRAVVGTYKHSEKSTTRETPQKAKQVTEKARKGRAKLSGLLCINQLVKQEKLP